MEKTIVVLARPSEHEKVVASLGSLMTTGESSAYKRCSSHLFTI